MKQWQTLPQKKQEVMYEKHTEPSFEQIPSSQTIDRDTGALTLIGSVRGAANPLHTQPAHSQHKILPC